MRDVIEWANAALEGVTEGPWTWTHGMDTRALVLGPDNLHVKLDGHADAQFIAAARTLVPELVAELEAARAEVERQRGASDRVEETRCVGCLHIWAHHTDIGTCGADGCPCMEFEEATDD